MPKLLQLKYIALWTNHIPVSPFDDQGCFVLFIYLFTFFWAPFPVAAQHNTVLVNWTTHENQFFYLVSFYYYLFIYLPANIFFSDGFSNDQANHRSDRLYSSRVQNVIMV